ncbi:bile acid:sodium symporter family protein [Chondrinema litorale]|uniref:bile acid:sodium symporter family protein n=1 Tax=Chondrinema litorale TaxID=2994555 RepID=UPI0025438A4B|nr:bile acid:sodium symporter family protein [Chondrinema litorale]UZR94025.1 bile acid:sodium symporter family protein [Chondrinema litorale]
MQLPNTVYKALLIASLVCFVTFCACYFAAFQAFVGPALVLSFILLAIIFTGFPKLSGFSFTIWIFAAVTASMFYPEYFTQYGSFKLSVLIVPLLQIIMFGMGTTMSVKDFVGVIKMPKGVIVGLVCQFSIMPIIGLSIAKVFDFPPEIAAGVILVGSSPSGLASNVMAFIAKANVALSVTLTACATLSAPIMTPFLMQKLAGQYVPIDFLGMMWSIFRMVIFPIVAGLLFHYSANEATKKSMIRIGVILISMVVVVFGISQFVDYAWLQEFWVLLGVVFVITLIGWFLKSFAEKLESIMPKVSMFGIAAIITVITASGRDSLLNIGLTLILVAFIHNITGYFSGYMLCKLIKLDEKSCRTIALEVGLQNSGLASAIAQEMGKVATVGLAPAIFGPLMNITGSSLATWWRGKPIKTEQPEKIPSP